MTVATFGSNTGVTYSGTEDCSIKSLTPTTPSDNTLIEVNKFALGTHANGLLRFPGLSNIPSGSTITAVTLTVENYFNGGTQVTGIFKCLKNWVETTATWNTIDGSVAWDTAGGLSSGVDIAASASDTQTIFSNTTVVFGSTAAMVADVQSWIPGGGVTNNGWLMQRTTGADDSTYIVLHSSTGTDGFRPLLTVTYTTPVATKDFGFKKYIFSSGIFSRSTVSAAVSMVLTDIGSWTTYTPKAVDTSTFSRTSFSQPGSRIYPIDTINGSDSTAEYYLWNGSAIINQAGSTTDINGIAYGTDPFNPQGLIKPYKNYSYVAPHRNGANNNTADTGDGSGDQIGSNQFTLGAGRNGFPDWWLFKRATTHDIYADLLAWRKLTTPSDTNTSSSLALPGGESTTYRSVMGSWGNPLLDRAKLTSGGAGGFFSRYALGTGSSDCPFKNVHYVGLHFDGHTRVADDSTHRYDFNLLYANSESVDVAFEDCLFDGTSGVAWQLGTDGALTLRRCLALYTYTASSNCSFLFTAQAGSAVLKIQDSIFVYNGYRGADPSGTPPVNSVFDRTLYLTGELDCINSEITNCVLLTSGSAEQCRAGLRFETNFLVSGGYTQAGNGGNLLANTGTLKNNILQKWMDPTGSVANPGYGISLAFGAHDVDFSGNIITNAGLTAGEKTASASYGAMGVGGTVPTWNHAMLNKTTSNTFANNISFLSGVSVGHIDSKNGVDDSNVAAVSGSWVLSNTITATAALVAATSCTLTVGWKGVTGSYPITFSDTTTKTVTLTHGNTAVSWTGAVTATATITSPAYATWLRPSDGVTTDYATFPDVDGNTFSASNIFVGGSIKTTYIAENGCKTPMPALSDTNTYTSGGGTLYADAAALLVDVPTATDPTRTFKRYMTESSILGAFPSVTSKEGAQEFALYVKNNIRKGQYDDRFLGRQSGNFIRAGFGVAAI